MADIEQFGVKATADVSNFLAGVEKYNTGISKLILNTGKAQEIINRTNLSFTQTGKGAQFRDISTGKFVAVKEVLSRVRQASLEVEQGFRNLGSTSEASVARVAALLRAIADQIQPAHQATRQLTVDVRDLGFAFESGSGQWKTAAGQTANALDIAKAATAKLREQITSLGTAGASSGERMTRSQQLVQRSIEATQRAEIALKQAQEKASKAITDVANATDDRNQKLEAAQSAVFSLLKAEVSYENAVRKSTQATEEANRVVQEQGSVLNQAKTVYSQVSSAVQVASAIFAKFMVVVGAVTVVLGVLGKAAKTAIDAIIAAFKALMSPITNAIERFKKFISTVSTIAFGVLVRDTVRSITRELREMGEAAIQAASDFQVLQIRLEAMETRLVGQSKGLTDYSQALAEGSIRAKALLGWIKQLSLSAPFDVKAIADTVALNLAMGFGEKQTKDLTVSMLSYAAAMGLGSEHMERMVFNFGQMKAAGKVTSTELRDLARGAFLPLSRIAEEMGKIMGDTGMSIQEVKEKAAEGTLPVTVFFQAFENMVKQDFPGALEKFSNTLVGVRTRFVNFMKTVVGLEFLGPTVNRITAMLRKTLDKLLTPEVLGKARVLGRVFLEVFNIIEWSIRDFVVPAFKALATAIGLPIPNAENLGQVMANLAVFIGAGIRGAASLIRQLADYITKTLSGMGTDAFTWGSNLISSFARGMAAAIAAVIRVIRWIANAIASLLRAFSPPKILPDLPKWGQAAMTSYLEGFTMADFSVLEGIQAPLEQALRLLVETGNIGESELGKRFVAISEGIAKVMTGELSADKLFSQIKSAAGPFGASIAELARRHIELAAAVDAVAEAEKKLADARKQEEESRIKVAKGIREYNALLRAGADEQTLRSRLALINADERAAQAAHEQAIAAEEQLSVAEEQEKKWQELVELQTKLVEQLIKLTEIQIVQPEQPEAETGGGAGAGAGAGIEEGLGDLLEELPSIDELGLPTEEEIKAKIDEMFKKARETVAGWVKQIGQWFQPIEDELAPTRDAVLNMFEEIGTWWDQNGPGIVAAVERTWGVMGTVISVIGAIIGNTMDNLAIAFGGFNKEGEKFNLIAFVIDTVTFAIFSKIAVPLTLLAGIVETVTKRFAEWRLEFEAIKIWVGDAGEKFRLWVDSVKTSLENMGKQDGSIANINKEFGKFKDTLVTLPTDLALGIIAGIGTFATEVATVMTTATGGIKTAWNTLGQELIFGSIIPEILQAILDAFRTKLNEVIAYITDEFTPSIQEFIDGILTDLKIMFEETLAIAFTFFKDFVMLPLQEYVDGEFTSSIEELIDGPLTRLNDYILDPLSVTVVMFTSPILSDLNAAFYALITAIDMVVAKLPSIKAGFDGIRAAVVALTAAVRELAAALDEIDIPPELSPGSPTPLETGFRGITSAIKELSEIRMPSVFSNMATKRSVPAPSVSTAGMSMSRNVQVNMGGVGIYNAMDEAVFTEKVVSIIKRSLS